MVQRRIVLHPQTRAKLQRDAKRCKDADTRIRYRIVLLSDQGWSGKRIIKALGCAPSTVSRTLDRFESYGAAGLVDRREDNARRRPMRRTRRPWRGFWNRRPRSSSTAARPGRGNC